jgi:hypothetical protein
MGWVIPIPIKNRFNFLLEIVMRDRISSPQCPAWRPARQNHALAAVADKHCLDAMFIWKSNQE